MTNQTKSTVEFVILNGIETQIITNYSLQKGALGDYAWHFSHIELKRAPKKSAVEKEYKISSKRLAYVGNTLSTMFEVFILEENSWHLAGHGYVKSTGVAHDKRCLKAYLMEDGYC